MNGKRKKWLGIAAIALALILVLAYAVAGPYLAMRGIDRAVSARKYGDLARYVDFPALRSNIKAQMQDRIARRYAQEAGAGALVGAVRTLADQVSENAVNMMVTPAGIGVLLSGDAFVRQLASAAETGGTPGAAQVQPRTAPMREAQTRYESLSRFTASVPNRSGKPVVFVFARQGLRWKLVDIDMPPQD